MSDELKHYLKKKTKRIRKAQLLMSLLAAFVLIALLVWAIASWLRQFTV